MSWQVILTKSIPIYNDPYRKGFFPRTFRYKKEAEALKKEVEKLGGSAQVIPTK